MWYSVSDKATAATALTMDNVPSSRRPLQRHRHHPFAAYDEQGSKLSGTVKISVTATTPKPSVPTTRHHGPHRHLQGRAQDHRHGVVLRRGWSPWPPPASWAAFEDGTFRPDGEVTYGQALKMIMMAAGYPEQAATTKHWASGYVAKAMSDGLLSRA